MSDEEKKAIDYLKNCLDNEYNFKNATRQKDKKAYNIILNLIEKQSKEIEHQKEKRENQKQELAILNANQIEFNKLVNTVNSYKGQFKRQQKEIEELRARNFELEFFDTNKKWKDKIKAKIEEVKDGIFDAKIVLQSLLEKE
jgi:hypothetical protein